VNKKIEEVSLDLAIDKGQDGEDRMAYKAEVILGKRSV
jgi:hypothetical protein